MVNLEHKMLQTPISREKALKPQKQGVATGFFKMQPMGTVLL